MIDSSLVLYVDRISLKTEPSSSSDWYARERLSRVNEVDN